MNGKLPKGYPREDRPRPVTYCVKCGAPHVSVSAAKICATSHTRRQTMKEKDIVWEGDNLWIGRTAKGEYTLFRNNSTHSTGFLKFTNMAQAIDNGVALDANMALVERMVK